MSFRNPFKQHHAPKKSAISRTEEREFERETKKLEQLDENSKMIYKDMKRCTESQLAQCRCETKIIQSIAASSLYKEDEELRKNIEAWSQTVTKMEGLTQELNTVCQKAVTEPMKKFTTVFPSVQQSIKKREQLLMEYTKQQSKSDKYTDRERTGQNRVKLETAKKALSTAKEEYDSHHTSLRQEMPQLYDGRVEYIQPSFHTLVKSQLKYYTDAYGVYTDISTQLNPDNHSCEDSCTAIQQNLDAIRGLTITAND